MREEQQTLKTQKTRTTERAADVRHRIIRSNGSGPLDTRVTQDDHILHTCRNDHIMVILHLIDSDFSQLPLMTSLNQSMIMKLRS
jgi:hypothetical protein